MRRLLWRGCLLALLALAGTPEANANLVTGSVNFEQLFLDAFTPGTGDGISIDTDGTVFGAISDSASVGVDLDGDGNDDINVDMSYQLHRSGTSDSRIGFRANSANTQLTMFSDSGAGVDFDHGFLEMNWTVRTIGMFGIDSLADFTASSLNGDTELYEFGIVDTSGALTAAEIAAYDATAYDGDDDEIDSIFNNTLGQTTDIMLEEFLGARAGVTYDTDVTAYTSDAGDDIVGGGGNDLGTISGAGLRQLTVFYGGFDVMNGTAAGSSSVGNPTGSLNWSGTVQLSAVPEPTTFGLLSIFGLMATVGASRRRPE